MRATIERWGRGLIVLATLTALAACTIGREPAYDAAVASEVTVLTAETLRLFQDFAPAVARAASRSHSDREPQYRALAARAETIRLMSEARAPAAPTGGILSRLAKLSVGTELPTDLAPDASARVAAYQDATPMFMADYLRNLAKLEAHDRAATGDQSAKEAAHAAELAAHQQEMEAYLDAFRLWQAGQGAQPAAPSAPPPPPIIGLDPIQIDLRITALEDILRDTLVYERDILNRDR